MVFVVASSCGLYAQSYHTDSKKSIRNYEAARQCFYDKDYDKALPLINKSLSYDEDFTDALLLKAELLMEKGKDTMAIGVYEKLFSVDSMAFPRASFALAKLYMGVHRYDDAVALLKWFMNLKHQRNDNAVYAEQQLNKALFRKDLYENPVFYNPRNIGAMLNTDADEYVNQYIVDEDKLVMTRRYKSEKKAYLEEKVLVAEKCDTTWLTPRILLNDLEDVGAANISSDGSEMYFSASGWNIGVGGCDIYSMRLSDGEWCKPVSLKAINTSEWESQPCISHDGKELYFVRRDKRTGTSDIYVAKRDDGDWTRPLRLDANINTDANEMAPFIHGDGKTLYFSSDRCLGMGGFDLFMSQRNEDGGWSEPVNLGYPLNTSGDEINLVVSNDAKKAFVSACKMGGHGGFDIYEFELDENFRPQRIELEKTLEEEYYADAFEKQESVVLRNIYFEFDKAELSPSSYEGVMTLVDFLVSYDEINIELIGHTDDMGDDDYNVSLSERRAENIRKALVDNGISVERIKIKGCGATQPLFPNDSDKHRALNRRVEMRFISP